MSGALSGYEVSDDMEVDPEPQEDDMAKSKYAPISVDPSLHFRKQSLRKKLEQFDAQITKMEREIRQTQILVNHKKEDRANALAELNFLSTGGGGKGKGKSGIDYTSQQFDWTKALKDKMKSIFHIEEFRLCQEGVCNANMDGRDIVCVMPTGGGKSLTYQLPALLQQGCTLVISPLISLITDQIIHLKESGVQAVKLTGGTPKPELDETIRRLRALARRTTSLPKDQEIKLCYVTPEKIGKSKHFVSLLQELAEGGQLARIVIDEAHCVSQLGHDFRPDYQRLHMLRSHLPDVPIMALSATCPPGVLKDLIKTLGLKATVDGNNADSRGTTYFTAPLYRKNLLYKVVPKPSKGSDVLQAMTTYILQEHRDDSGIVYCLSKKDAEKVAAGLQQLSGNIIKTGVYHADRHDREKETLHLDWRRGKIKVVCATIAFGLGIDKGDVRFVLHHSLSKSMEGFYQESGRAGRDGKDSDCVLYYRPQDATTLCAMVTRDKDGQNKLYKMLKFAQELHVCRKTQFAEYFSDSSKLKISAWGADALSECGHCDNCTRPKEELEKRDVTLQAWQLVKITEALNNNGASVTMNLLIALSRGGARGTYGVGRGKKGKEREKQSLDLDGIAGGEVAMSKEDIERLVVELTLGTYLAETCRQNAFSTNVYMTCGPLAHSLTSYTREEIIKSSKVERIRCTFLKTAKKPVTRSKPKKNPDSGKRKRLASEDHADLDMFDDNEDDEDEAFSNFIPPHLKSEDNSDSDEIFDGWTYSVRKDPLTQRTVSRTKKTKLSDEAMDPSSIIILSD